MNKIKEFVSDLPETTTMTTKEYFLTITTCLLGGLVIGMLCSPRKYTKIGCGNGSNNRNNRVSNDQKKSKKDCGKNKKNKKKKLR